MADEPLIVANLLEEAVRANPGFHPEFNADSMKQMGQLLGRPALVYHDNCNIGTAYYTDPAVKGDFSRVVFKRGRSPDLIMQRQEAAVYIHPEGLEFFVLELRTPKGMVFLDVCAGSDFDESIALLLKLSEWLEVPGRCEFNGRQYTVTGYGPTPDTLAGIRAERDARIERDRREYAESPEGLAEAAERAEEERLRANREANLLNNLPELLKHGTGDHLLQWFCDLEENWGAESRNKSEFIRESVAAAGWVENAHVGKHEEIEADPKMQLEYIIGQCLNCLGERMPPHQIVHHFAEQYRAKTAA